MSGRRTDYLTVAEILAIHNDLIERYGGAAGVREFRPQTGYYGPERSRKRLRDGKVSHISTTSPRDHWAGPAM